MPSEYRKFALLLLLLVPCVWLVRRNLFPPASPAASNARTAAPGARSGQDRALAAAVGEGTAQQSGGPRRAFLTDGEEILIAKEGEIVAKFYKINRIGVSSLELEDTRSSEKQKLALIEE